MIRNQCSYDNVNAVVCDPGSHTFRIGFARHHHPNVEVSAMVGVPVAALDPGVKPDGRINDRAPVPYCVDVTSLCTPLEGMEMVSYMNDGVIENWDLFEKVFEYSFANYVRSDPRNHPLLFTEPPRNMAYKRGELTELMFEKYQVPSLCLTVDAVLAAYALLGFHGTAMVIDSGATHTSVVPVSDGSVISDCILDNPLGGNFVSALCKRFFQTNEIEVVPRYMIANTRPVKPKEIPIWTKRATLSKVTKSWHSYMCDMVVNDFKESVLEVSNLPFDGEITPTHPTYHYTFPNGYNQEFGKERFEIPDTLFGPNPYSFGSPLSLSHMVTTSIKMCDEHLRSDLYNNVIVVGGNAMLKGYQKRLSNDINAYKPYEYRLRMVGPFRTIDTQYGAWIGGSLIASDESADELWFTSYEYQEHGKSYIHYKCPK